MSVVSQACKVLSGAACAHKLCRQTQLHMCHDFIVVARIRHAMLHSVSCQLVGCQRWLLPKQACVPTGDKGNGTYSRILDYNNLVNAIEVLDGATYGLQDFLITGVPWSARGSNMTSGLPGCSSCPFLYPAVIMYPNSTVSSPSHTTYMLVLMT